MEMSSRIKLLGNSYLACSNINERYNIRLASFTSVVEIFCITSYLGVSGFSYCIFLIFDCTKLSEFSADLQVPVSKIIS